MEVKRNVRRRRLERIRQLLGRESAGVQEEIRPLKPEQTDKPSLVPSTLTSIMPDDPRMQDPEFVWKMKYRNGRGINSWADSGEDDEHEGDWSKIWLRRLRIRSLVCLVLLALIWGLFQLRLPWAEKGKSAISHYLTEPLKFESVATWFEQTFGDAPTFIPTYRQDKQEETMKVSLGQKRTYFAPLQGVVSMPFTSGRSGIELLTEAGKPVSALDDGQVTAAGLTDETGYTVTILHPNGVQSTYGWLEQPRVNANDWVKGGETIGYAGTSSKGEGILFYAIKADKTYVNPAEVVAFD